MIHKRSIDFHQKHEGLLTENMYIDCARCDSFEMKQTSTQTLQDLCAYVFHQQQQNPQSMHSSLPSQTQFATI